MLLMSIGMVKGEFRDGPFGHRTLCWSSSVLSPPMPLLTIDAETIAIDLFRRSMPPSSIAIFAAAMASCAKRSVRRTSFGFLK